MNPFLSIIVPIYKVEQYLHQCIDSILAQTFLDYELILVNDGSPDNCPQICDEYAKLNNRIKVIHKENGGLVSARKAGLKEARGVYVGYVDSDDWIEENMFELLCRAAMEYKTDIVLCDVLHSYPDREIKSNQIIAPGYYDKNKLVNKVYPIMLYSGVFYKFGLYPAVWNKIFKKDILEKNQYNVNDIIQMGEDAACTYPCLLDANSIFVLENKYLYHYRQTESSMTRKYDEKYLERVVVLNNVLVENLENKKKVYDLSEQLYYYLTFLIIGALNNEFSKQNTKNDSEKRNFVKKMLSNIDIVKALNMVSIGKIPLKSKVYISLLRKKQVYLIYILYKIQTLLNKNRS
jgi:glycosyltransferase involved in cell wall biosynthesis